MTAPRDLTALFINEKKITKRKLRIFYFLLAISSQ